MQEKLYNIKMRAAQGGSHEKGGKHISGAERIVFEESLELTIAGLLRRAYTHSKGRADFINISLEEIKKEQITYISSLPITTVEVEDYLEGRKGVVHCLENIGLSSQKAQAILSLLVEAPVIRGAMVVDINSLKRLEPNLSRGVRVTGMDWIPNILPELNSLLDKEGINNTHVREAVALASKVARAPGIVAEICWSDDPEYTAGYVASEKFGYIRIIHLKPLGVSKGGRVFCFDSTQATLEECLNWLENRITIVNEVNLHKGRFTLQEYLKE